MSRFYASIQGERKEATRQGHKGIQGHIRGWTVGGEVECHPAPEVDGSDSDWVHLTATGGSSGYWRAPVARLRSLPGGFVLVEIEEAFGGLAVTLDPQGRPVEPSAAAS